MEKKYHLRLKRGVKGNCAHCQVIERLDKCQTERIFWGKEGEKSAGFEQKEDNSDLEKCRLIIVVS